MSPRSSTNSYPAFAHIRLRENPGKNLNQSVDSKRAIAVKPALRPKFDLSCVRNCGAGSPEIECSGPQLRDLSSKFSGLSLKVWGSRYCELDNGGGVDDDDDDDDDDAYRNGYVNGGFKNGVNLLWNTKADIVCDRLTINITLDNFAKKLIIKILTSRIKATTVKIFSGLYKPVGEKSYHTELLKVGRKRGIRFQSRLDIRRALRWSVGEISRNTAADESIVFQEFGNVLLTWQEIIFVVCNVKTVILLVVLYGCETWTLTLREEQRIRVFENKILRKIFGAKRDEVTGEWRKIHNAELHALFSSPDIIRNIKSRRLRWAGHVAHMGEYINAYKVLVGKPEGKKTFGEDNIKMDLREVGYVYREWINLSQDRDQWRAYVRTAMNLRVP
ncbi:hypothetical protein ANN_02745 [Periplaneta americana]|uniref:Uncharacterized protein n=1 Tax=Periplaneta americana TaxID=6978 RepID=A0ABQ8TX64_PERAM|nr:hypothetical protein ANN_02745 [Periplaneta americana]